MNSKLINLFEGYLKETDISFDLRESTNLGLSSKKSDVYYFKVPGEHRMLTIEIKDIDPINEANIKINKINIVGGINSSGKSTVGKILYLVRYKVIYL